MQSALAYLHLGPLWSFSNFHFTANYFGVVHKQPLTFLYIFRPHPHLHLTHFNGVIVFFFFEQYFIYGFLKIILEQQKLFKKDALKREIQKQGHVMRDTGFWFYEEVETSHPKYYNFKLFLRVFRHLWIALYFVRH